MLSLNKALKHKGRVEVQIDSFLNLALDGGEWSAPHLLLYPQCKSPLPTEQEEWWAFEVVLTKWQRTYILICQNSNFGSSSSWSKYQNFSHNIWSHPTDDSN